MTKKIALVLIDGFADWEFGFLAGAAVGWLGCETRVLSLKQGPVKSIGGVRAVPDDLLTEARPREYDGVAVIGSAGWDNDATSMASPVLLGMYHDGAVVGAICGGTIAAARAGLLDEIAHTSNSAAYLTQNADKYRGAEFYRDAPHAVRTGRVITAPGSAPATFAVEFLLALLPEQAEQIEGMRAMFAKEHQG
jgi:putative intracellular protease/amidase